MPSFFVALLFLLSMMVSCESYQCQSPLAPPPLTGQEIVQQLDSLHFFDLTSPAELATTKQAFVQSKEELNYFGGMLRGESLVYTDGHFFALDAEYLFEVGGLIYYLEQVKPSFEKLGLALVYKQEKNVPSSLDWNHTIDLNGTTYTVFEGNFSDKDWVIAYSNFISMLNEQLALQGSAYQFYPIKADNDGAMVLLTPAQFQVVQANYPKDGEHPRSWESWREEHGL